MIADTSFIIDLMRKNAAAQDKLNEIEKNSESQYTTSPTVFELSTGIALSNWPEKEKNKVEELLSQFSVIHFSENHAFVSGRILGTLYKQGNPIDPVDAQIAGIAIVEEEKIITRNAKHFERIHGVRFELY